MTNIAKLILQSSLGEELSEEEAGVLSSLLRSRELVDGEFLINEGTTDDSLHVLLGGRLEVMKRTVGDDLVSLAVLKEGDLAGELEYRTN